MKVFQDVFTNDEIMSDVFKFELSYDDVIMRVQSRLVSKDNNVNVDIGCGNAFGGGEEEDGGAEGGASEGVLDVVYNHGLVQTFLSKSEFMTYFKGFAKKSLEWLNANGKADRAAAFKKGAADFFNLVRGEQFEEYEFFTGTSESLDGSIAISFWEKEDATGPVFYFFKDLLKEVKC